MAEMPDFIRRAIEAQGRVDPDEVAEKIADEHVIPSDEVVAAEEQGWTPAMSEEADLSPEEIQMIQPSLLDPESQAVGAWHAPESGAPETERLAAIAQWPKSGTDRRRVLDHLASCGDHGATDEEIALALTMRHYTAAPRRTELRDQGWIRDSGKRRPTTTGTAAAVWVLTDQGRVDHPRLEQS